VLRPDARPGASQHPARPLHRPLQPGRQAGFAPLHSSLGCPGALLAAVLKAPPPCWRPHPLPPGCQGRAAAQQRVGPPQEGRGAAGAPVQPDRHQQRGSQGWRQRRAALRVREGLRRLRPAAGRRRARARRARGGPRARAAQLRRQPDELGACTRPAGGPAPPAVLLAAPASWCLVSSCQASRPPSPPPPHPTAPASTHLQQQQPARCTAWPGEPQLRCWHADAGVLQRHRPCPRPSQGAQGGLGRPGPWRRCRRQRGAQRPAARQQGRARRARARRARRQRRPGRACGALGRSGGGCGGALPLADHGCVRGLAGWLAGRP
jgi:hypothetical protein